MRALATPIPDVKRPCTCTDVSANLLYGFEHVKALGLLLVKQLSLPLADSQTLSPSVSPEIEAW